MNRRSSPLFLLGLVVVLLVAAPAASAEQPTAFDVHSRDYDIGSPVWVNITGPGGMSISIRITDAGGVIVSGRDTALDAGGNYSHVWTPSAEGNYNVTVIWSTGFTLTKTVLIQDKVTSREIGDLYQTIFRMELQLKALIAENQRTVNIAIALGAVSAFVAAASFVYVRNAAPRPKTEFERFLEEDIRARVRKKE